MTAAAFSPADAHLLLGQLALNTGGAAQGQAPDWFRRAARSGDARAFTMLGRCYDQGWGVDADPAQAAACFRRAADLGDAWGLFNLADLYAQGRGVPQNDATAADLYAQAARKGLNKALNMLGLLHEEGRGVPLNPTAAREFFAAAADSGDCWGCFNHARMLIADGNSDAALPWLEQALTCGFPAFYQAMASALKDSADPRLQALRHRAEALTGERG